MWEEVVDRRGQRGELDELAFLQLGVGDDERLALTGEVAALLEERRGRGERAGDRVDGGGPGRRIRDPVHQEVPKNGGAGEEDLPLVGEVAEERPLRQPGPGRDVRHGGPAEAALTVELDRRLEQAAGGVRFPAGHAARLRQSLSLRHCSH